MPLSEELEQRSIIADAKLEVAESLGWSSAFISLPGVYYLSESWVITIIGFGLVYYLSTYKYRRDANFAEDAFHKEMGIGKYCSKT